MTAIDRQITRPSRPLGLTQAEVVARREQGQSNTVPFETSRSYRRILLQNTFTFINILLFVIVIMLLALQLWGDALMTAIIVFANVVVAIVQEMRAKRQLDRIALLTRPSATVIRDGREQTIEPGEIVLGDLLVVRPGDQILVDGEIVGGGEISADESLLTGESDLVPKQEGETVHSGTFCMTGSAMFLARRVGADSVAQRITAEARTFRDPQTPLQVEIGLVLRIMLVLAAALSLQAIMSLRDIHHGLPLSETVQAAAVLISLVPQGLALMVTVTYAMAAVRMSGKGALIQRMNAVESTSHIDMLCVDKTGTLTSNQLALQAIQPLSMDAEQLDATLAAYAAATTAKNRTIEAIEAGCAGRPGSLGIVREEIPFSSQRKWSALRFEGDDLSGVYVLGAPEMLRPALQAREAEALDHDAAGWLAQGLRVLLLAHRADQAPLRDAAGEPQLPGGLTPLGLVVLSDELRPEARETIARFRAGGIGLKIISGDHPETVAALARQAGLPPDLRAVSGLTIDGLGEGDLELVAEDATVFGRITPEQKRRLVEALKRRGHYVAMIGDGVNDVLALKQADLAVSMQSGNQVTRNTADIVLLEDSFAALPNAFQEGQRIRRGMQDIIRLFLVRTLSVALIIFGTSAIGLAFPFTPKNNGLLALLTVGIPTFALAAWAQPAKTPRRLVLSGSHFVLPAAATIAAVGLLIYHFYLRGTGSVEVARTALTTITIFCGLILIPFAQPPNEAFVGGNDLNGDWKPTILAIAMVAAFGFVLGVPFLRDFYGVGFLTVPGYLIIILVAIGWATSLRFLWRLDILARTRALWQRVAT